MMRKKYRYYYKNPGYGIFPEMKNIVVDNNKEEEKVFIKWF